MVTKVLNYFSEIYSKLVNYWNILLYVIIFQREKRGGKLYHGWKAEYFNTVILCLCNNELLYIIFIVVTVVFPI